GRPSQSVVDGDHIRPKDGSAGLVVLLIKEELGVATRIAVGVHKKQFFKWRVDCREHLQLPAVKAAGGVAAAYLIGIDALNLKGSQKRLAFIGHLVVATQVPDLDRQRATQMTQGTNGDIERGEKAVPAAGDDNPSAAITLFRVYRNGR